MTAAAVVACAEVNHVVATSAVGIVIAFTAIEFVLAAIAAHVVIAVTTKDGVVVIAAVDPVISSKREIHVIAVDQAHNITVDGADTCVVALSGNKGGGNCIEAKCVVVGR